MHTRNRIRPEDGQQVLEALTAAGSRKELFMEAATKNRRGRPKKIGNQIAENAFNDMEPRAAQNVYYAGKAFLTLEGENADPEVKDFFVTARGNYRRQGILEQLGRMLEEGSITVEDGRGLLRECMADYKQGESVKIIEKRLRTLRRLWKEDRL